MPQYGAEYARAPALLDDYRGHAPDAPASLDYKYEEDAPPPPAEPEKPTKRDDDEDPWREPPRPPKRRVAVTERSGPLPEELDSEVPQAVSRRRPRRKPRARRAKSRRDERSRNRYKHDDERIAQYFDNVDYPDDGNKYLEGEELVSAGETTARVVKRKPRERLFAPPPPPPTPGGTGEPPDEREADDEEPETHRLKEEQKFNDPEEWSKPPAMRYRPLIAEETTAGDGRRKYSPYQDYGDYYDQKKVDDIRNKLPTLHRRTTTIADMIRVPPARPKPDLLNALWPSRRAGQAFTTPELPPLTAHEPASPAARARTRPETPADLSTYRALYTADVGAYLAAGNAATETASVSTSASTSRATVPPELSLAEKSRLSILKKARLKETEKWVETKKPPVLLHVTSRLPTVVMVEPATSADPWMRAREVVDDSPETIDKVKRLMRQKLVARAKSIGELTDDWDQVVCDYVDIGMLGTDAAPTIAPPPPLFRALLAAVLALSLL